MRLPLFIILARAAAATDDCVVLDAQGATSQVRVVPEDRAGTPLAHHWLKVLAGDGTVRREGRGSSVWHGRKQ